jgi:hypothetical protein
MGSSLAQQRARSRYLYGTKGQTRRERNVSLSPPRSDTKLTVSTMTRVPAQAGWMTPDSTRKVSLPSLRSSTQSQVQKTPPTPIGVSNASPPQPTTPASPWSIVQNHRFRGPGAIASAPVFSPLTSPRSDHGGLGYRHLDPSGPLPRNLYVMGLPLDLTQ